MRFFWQYGPNSSPLLVSSMPIVIFDSPNFLRFKPIRPPTWIYIVALAFYGKAENWKAREGTCYTYLLRNGFMGLQMIQNSDRFC